MKFMKGMLVGTLISAGVMYMMSENEGKKNGNVIITFPLTIYIKN